MPENKLVNLSTKFAIDIINSCDKIKVNSSFVGQFARSGTSIGANIREANYAQSKADFIHKLQIALKECYETEYWIELFMETGKIDEETGKSLKASCGAIRRMLVASLNTVKNK